MTGTNAPAPADGGAHQRDPLGLIRGGEGVITGTVVCAAVIASTAGHSTTTRELVTAIVGTVLIYWLAHLHARTISAAVANNQHPLAAFRESLSHTWFIAAASLLPVVILLLAEVLGADLRTAAWVSLWCTVGLLAVYSYVAGRRGGLGTGGSLACACAGGALGLLVALLKATLH